MAQIKNYQQLELLSTNFIRRDETNPLTIASLDVIGNVDIGGTLDVTGATTGISHGDLDDLGVDDHTQYMKSMTWQVDNRLVKIDNSVRQLQPTGVSLDDSENMSGVSTFMANGTIYANYSSTRQAVLTGSSLELGIKEGGGSTAGYSFIDFHVNAYDNDYDCRIIVDNGSGSDSDGYGNMDIVARGGLDLLVYPDDVYIDNDLYVVNDAEINGDLTVTTSGDRYHGTYVGYIYHPIAAVEILNQSTSTDTSRNQIDVSTDGIPTSAKALNVRIAVRDSGSAATDCYVVFYDASSGGSTTGTFSPMPVNDRYGRYSAVLNSGSNGDIWWTAQASGASTLDITVLCTGYWL